MISTQDQSFCKNVHGLYNQGRLQNAINHEKLTKLTFSMWLVCSCAVFISFKYLMHPIWVNTVHYFAMVLHVNSLFFIQDLRLVSLVPWFWFLRLQPMWNYTIFPCPQGAITCFVWLFYVRITVLFCQVIPWWEVESGGRTVFIFYLFVCSYI